MNAANKESMGQGVGIGVEAGDFGGLLTGENRKSCQSRSSMCNLCVFIKVQNKQNNKKQLYNLTCAIFIS